MALGFTDEEVIPTKEEFEKLISAKISYEKAQAKPAAEKEAWNRKNFTQTPWGIAYNVSKAKYDKAAAYAKSKGRPSQNEDVKKTLALRYFIGAVVLGWQELIDQLKRTLKNWNITSEYLQQLAKDFWQTNTNASLITARFIQAQSGNNIVLTEDIEKHKTLNTKLFTEEELLKDKVRDKMLEIVDTFLADLKEQDIKIKVDDILLIGSNASYNYTKNSDIDLHILANTKAVEYPADLGNALYSAYRSIFNKQLDITIFDIPLEVFVETEDSKRVSNGVYSVKKNKWLKKPVAEDIPEYDKDALDTLVSKWEAKYKDLIADIEADKLDDEKNVVKMLEDIYDKLRKKGVAKGEYSIENLAFKELRNKGYLDKLKEFRNELTSKRLSLEERLDRKHRAEIYSQIAQAAGTAPIIQDNGMFFIYNLKSSDITRVTQALKRLPFVTDIYTHENGKYDFSKMAMTNLPTKYYDIRGQINTAL